MSHKAFTIEEEQNIVRRYESGETIPIIIESFARAGRVVSTTPVCRVLKEAGITTRQKATEKRLTPEVRSQIADACRAGDKIDDVAARHAIANRTVKKIIRELGVTMKTGRRPWRDINHAAFDALSPESEYWLGMLFSDGAVIHDEWGSPHIALALAERDVSHVEKFRVFLRSEHKVAIYPARTRPDNYDWDIWGGPMAYFKARSEHIAKMVEARGMVRVKAERKPSSEIADSSHFWRGAIDGDGSVGWTGDKPYVGFSGQRVIVQAFIDYLRRRGIGHNIHPNPHNTIFTTSVSDEEAIATIRLLYVDAPIALDRKHQTALHILNGGARTTPEVRRDPPMGKRDKAKRVDGIHPVTMSEVRDLCEKFHAYGSSGQISTYAYGWFESRALVAAFAWQPPAPGSAMSVCPEAPQGVLALSRMVAVPREARQLTHISEPLRAIMSEHIDRTRWPVLVTYSDEGQGHRGAVYRHAGWQPTAREERPFYVDGAGRRASVSTSRTAKDRNLELAGKTTLRRWEHWACDRGQAHAWMLSHGWRRVAVEGKVWRSGNLAFTYVRDIDGVEQDDRVVVRDDSQV